MIKHIVMWKLKEENKEQNALKIKNDLEDLKDKIEEIKSIEVGINFNNSEAAYDIVLYSEFETEDDLNSYQANKYHKEVGVFVRASVSERKVVDYKI